MDNINQKLRQHNRKNGTNGTDQKSSCNCWKENNCPFDGKCLTLNMFITTVISRDVPYMYYTGVTEESQKNRYKNHNPRLI